MCKLTAKQLLGMFDLIIEAFPGLLDGNTEVNGSDLTEYMTQVMQEVFPD